MALTPQALVEIVASDLQLPVSTVRNFDRRLMETGLRTKKGHGRGSAIMTPADAATLLVALAASDEISRVADCVIKARKLPICSTPEVTHESHSADNEIVQLAATIGCKSAVFATFGSALDAVMSYLARKPVHDYLFTFSVDSVGGSPLTAALIITHASTDGLSMVEFRRAGTADRYITNALRVKRYVSGAVLSHVASEIGFVTKPEEGR